MSREAFKDRDCWRGPDVSPNRKQGWQGNRKAGALVP